MSRWVLGRLLIVAALTLPVAVASHERAREGSASATVAGPGDALPVDKVHTYRMAGKIRLLLFWVGRDGVGMGRIVWRRGENGVKAYELLIGTDPASAPRRLNLWGYIAEEIDGANGSLLALMSRSEETSIDEVRDRPQRGVEFKAMRTRVEAGTARSVAPAVYAESDPTYRDVSALIDQVHLASDRATIRTLAVPIGVRPGFLAAVAELVHASVESLRAPRPAAASPHLRAVPFVYGVRLHDLTLRSHEVLTDYNQAGRSDGRVVRGRFEIRDRTTDERTRFELVYGLDGPLAAVPVEIVYQPRWWLKVELTLEQ